MSDFGVLERLRPRDIPAAASMRMKELMSPPISVKSSCGLLRSFAIMTKHHLQDLPVVDEEGRLIGIASRVDIAAAFFRDFITTGHLA
ncbi:MAG: CBS domain-containing protein [Anaerolineae bacterium]